MTYTYTKHGPFVNNSAPGIDQTFLNDIESALLAINTNKIATDTNMSSNGLGILTALSMMINPTAVTVNGTVSGSVSLYQYLQGTVKSCLVVFNNYKSGAAQTLTLPVAFTGNSLWSVSELQGGKVEGLLSGTAQTFSVQATTAVAGGTQGSQTFVNSWSFALCRSGFDTLRVTVTGSSATSSVMKIDGI